jgi:hypothetical protein
MSKKNATKVMTIRLPVKYFEVLEKIAEANNLSSSAMARIFLVGQMVAMTTKDLKAVFVASALERAELVKDKGLREEWENIAKDKNLIIESSKRVINQAMDEGLVLEGYIKDKRSREEWENITENRKLIIESNKKLINQAMDEGLVSEGNIEEEKTKRRD